jgi:hypothetical protein
MVAAFKLESLAGIVGIRTQSWRRRHSGHDLAPPSGLFIAARDLIPTWPFAVRNQDAGLDLSVRSGSPPLLQ